MSSTVSHAILLVTSGLLAAIGGAAITLVIAADQIRKRQK